MSIEEVSKAELYVQQKNWNYRASDDQLILQLCPITGCDNFHFYMRRGGEKDGLWDCKKCGENGNLYTLREKLHDPDLNIVSSKEMVTKKDTLPDIALCQARLEADEEAMNYLLDERGFTPALIRERLLGLMVQNGKKYLVIPYIENRHQVFAKYRTLPPAEKGFFSSKGWDTCLYNADVITQGMDELILTEGELNVVASIGQGMRNVVGVPGANNKKMTWISKIDAAAPKKIYILYDNDINNSKNVGQLAAEELSKRLALNTALPTPLNIVLPEFEAKDGSRGKDLNDWFVAGHTVAEFNVAKAQAMPFEVRGVVSLPDALSRLEQSFEGKEILQPTYVSQWEQFNQMIGGFEPGDVIDVIAKGKIGKTTFGLNLIDHLINAYNETGFIHCLEMPVDRMVRKWVSYATGTDDSPAVTIEQGREAMAKMRLAIPKAREIIAAREADLLFSDRQVRHSDELFEIWYQAVRRYGIKFGMFDNLQLLADRTLRRSSDRTIHMSQISKNFKAMATELRLVLIRIIQPKKITKGDIVSHEDSDGSSQIEKDCDATVALHRVQKHKLDDAQIQAIGFMNEELAMEPILYTHVSITRYAAGGICTLWIDGARSMVRNITPLEFSNIKSGPVGTGMPMLQHDTQHQIEA